MPQTALRILIHYWKLFSIDLRLGRYSYLNTCFHPLRLICSLSYHCSFKTSNLIAPFIHNYLYFINRCGLLHYQEWRENLSFLRFCEWGPRAKHFVQVIISMLFAEACYRDFKLHQIWLPVVLWFALEQKSFRCSFFHHMWSPRCDPRW